MVIKETLRLFPIAPVMARELIGDIKLGAFSIVIYWANLRKELVLFRNTFYLGKNFDGL